MLTFESIKAIILEELRAKGYAPNPGDVVTSANRIMELHKEEVEVAAGESVEEAKKLASAGSPLITPPAK